MVSPYACLLSVIVPIAAVKVGFAQERAREEWQNTGNGHSQAAGQYSSCHNFELKKCSSTLNKTLA